MRKDMNYIVLDVETPNGKNDSICSIGVELIDDDKVTDEWYTLVDPEEEFESMNIAIHHITPGMVQGAPKFEEVWARIAPYAATRVFVAHNAEFDLTVLAQALTLRGMDIPSIKYICTVDLGRRVHYNFTNVKGDLVLSNFSRTLGVELTEHHNALFDTRACAGIFLKLREMYGFDPAAYVKKFRFPKSHPHRPDLRRGLF